MKIRIAYAAALVLALTASSAHAVSIRGFPSCGSWVKPAPMLGCSAWGGRILGRFERTDVVARVFVGARSRRE